jgi:hypothetical protein
MADDPDYLMSVASEQIKALLELKRTLVIKSEALTPKNMRAELYAVLLRSELVKKSPPRSAPVRKPMNVMSEAEFIAFLEAEPSLEGVDIRREIGKCQFWCKANGVQPTRARLVNWMKKADRQLLTNAAGQSSFAPKKPEPVFEPAGWREWVRENATDPTNADKPWAAMDRASQQYILAQLQSKQNAA